jgi:solute carrier family 25 S-adenosylmethionine transporter 26
MVNWEDFFTLLYSSVIAGGLAGCAVDFALFPLDSLKTRIQHGGKGATLSFTNIYAGLSTSMLASFP